MKESLIHSIAETFKTLGDPTRVHILFLLSKGEVSVRDLSRALSLTSSAISHQLRLLRSLRLVKRRRQGRMMYYSLDDEHVISLFGECAKHVEHGMR